MTNLNGSTSITSQKIEGLVGQEIEKIILFYLIGEILPEKDVKIDAVYTGGGVQFVFKSGAIFFNANQINGYYYGNELEISDPSETFILNQIELLDISSMGLYSSFIKHKISIAEPIIDRNCVLGVQFNFENCNLLLEVLLSDGFREMDSDDILLRILKIDV